MEYGEAVQPQSQNVQPILASFQEFNSSQAV